MIGSSDGESGSGLRLWALVRLHRGVLAVVILLGVFLGLVAGAAVGPQAFRTLVVQHNALRYVFAAFIGVIVTGVSLVVSLNQLVLSQELGALGDQRDRMEGATRFRTDLEELLGLEVAPSEPSAFVRAILDDLRERGERLRGDARSDAGPTGGNARSEAGPTGGDDLEADVDEFVAALLAEAEAVDDRLADAEFGTFNVLWNVLRFDYSRHINAARRLRARHGEALSERRRGILDHLIEVLRLFGPAREHFKTLYFQWALVDLSRLLLYLSVPALVVIGVFMMTVSADDFPGRTLGVDHLMWAASAVYTVGLSPFVVFLVYVLRIATVAKRTLAIGPFVLERSERGSDRE